MGVRVGGHSMKFPASITPDERRWFHACPKAVLYEIARSLAMQINRSWEYEAGHKLLADRWRVLYDIGAIEYRPCEADGRFE